MYLHSWDSEVSTCSEVVANGTNRLEGCVGMRISETGEDEPPMHFILSHESSAV